MIRFVVPAICIGLMSSAVSEAQSVAAATPAGAIEFALGHAAFVDDAAIHHSVVGGSVRLQVLPRVAIGPELVYRQGPRDDRDWMLTGNVTFDLRAPQQRPRIVPFLVAGAGLLRHHDRFGGIPFVSSEGAFTAMQLAQTLAENKVKLVPDIAVGGGGNGAGSGLAEVLISRMLQGSAAGVAEAKHSVA